MTGLSGLSFFQALKTEVVQPTVNMSLGSCAIQDDAANEVNDAFPDHLREPVLRRVQHSTISRIDNLGKFSIRVHANDPHKLTFI